MSGAATRAALMPVVLPAFGHRSGRCSRMRARAKGAAHDAAAVARAGKLHKQRPGAVYTLNNACVTEQGTVAGEPGVIWLWVLACLTLDPVSPQRQRRGPQRRSVLLLGTLHMH